MQSTNQPARWDTCGVQFPDDDSWASRIFGFDLKSQFAQNLIQPIQSYICVYISSFEYKNIRVNVGLNFFLSFFSCIECLYKFIYIDSMCLWLSVYLWVWSHVKDVYIIILLNTCVLLHFDMLFTYLCLCRNTYINNENSWLFVEYYCCLLMVDELFV